MKEFAVRHEAVGMGMLGGNRHFLEALTRWNYFPNQKATASELPPNITTKRFTPEVARQLANNCKAGEKRRGLHFDLIEYRATRYNNVSRVLGLMHPLAYSHIVLAFEKITTKFLRQLRAKIARFR